MPEIQGKAGMISRRMLDPQQQKEFHFRVYKTASIVILCFFWGKMNCNAGMLCWHVSINPLIPLTGKRC